MPAPKIRWRSWTDPVIHPPRNRPILAFFPPYGVATLEWTLRRGGCWVEVTSGRVLYDDFPSHWADNLPAPEV